MTEILQTAFLGHAVWLWLVFVTVVVAGLTFFPALSLAPIAEALQ